MRRLLVAFALFGAMAAHAEDEILICYNYGCAAKAWVRFSDEQLAEVRALIDEAEDPVAERRAIGLAVGRMYSLAGQQSPIWRDRGGDYEDEEIDGRMDCIDHSTNTNSWLLLFARRGWLRFHAVRPPVRRGVFAVHHAARIAETATRQEFVVDSWFFDNGYPALIFTLREWLGGARANGH